MNCPAPGCELEQGHSTHHRAGERTWVDLRPTSGKAEFHLTLACDLDCSGCNRASFLRQPHTGRMTLDDADEFFRQADALNWHPSIILVGGEPTLHPDFESFVDLVHQRTGQPPQVWSNAYSPRAQRQLLRIKGKASVVPDTAKPDGAVRGPTEDRSYWVDDIYISPADYGLTRDHCFQHASAICGVAVDHEGYTPCAMGAIHAALLGVQCRTKRLADLFDKEKVAAMTAAMCRNCGHQMMGKQVDASTLPRRFDTPMSPTWEKAFDGRR